MCVVIFSSRVQAFAGGNCTVDFGAHGTFEVGVEAGCWVFVTDDGQVYQPMGGNQSIYQEGLSGVLTGHVNPFIMTTCMQGTALDVCDFDADDQVNLVGTLELQDNGCWIIKSGNKRFLTISEDPTFYVDGAKVKITGVPLYNVRTYCVVEGVLDVLTFDFIGGGHNAKAAKRNCHAEYAHCRKTCREAQCLISCEDVFNYCIGSTN